MLQHQQPQRPADRADLVRPRRILRYGGQQPHQVITHGVVQVVLVAEVGVERHRADAELGGDAAKAEARPVPLPSISSSAVRTISSALSVFRGVRAM